MWLQAIYEIQLTGLLILVPSLSSLLLLQLFTEAVGVLSKTGGLNMQVLEEFEALGAKARASSQEMMDAEALLGDIPEEFLDPIQVFLSSPTF